MSNLIILDLNGTLILRKGDKVYLRKNLKEFKDFCFSIADVAVYTSMQLKNIKLEEIFTHEEINKLIFVWDRSKTMKDPEAINKWDTIKNLGVIISKYPNYKRYIIIDDSPNKVRFIHGDCKLLVPPFENEKESENVLLEIIDKLKEKLI